MSDGSNSTGVVTTARRGAGAVVLTRQAVERWPAALLASGSRVVAPMLGRGGIEYAELQVNKPAPMHLGAGLSRQSPKAAWFPRSEPIVKLRREGKQWSVDDPALAFPPAVVFAARPCDAAAPEVLAPLFGWDYHDPFFEKRKANLAFVVLACGQPMDSACFCTSVGVDPAGQGLGDVLLTPLNGDRFLAEAHTAAGQRLLEALPSEDRQEAAAAPQQEIAGFRSAARQAIPTRFDPALVRQALETRFEDPMWQKSVRSCLACGTCAFVCPTCHCFDIQDETVGGRGLRQKNWDACAFPLFSLHTSGHNPRPDQAARWRQRLNHKFRYYPDKFGRVLCTGCGRCMRLCPAGMDLLADLEKLSGNGQAGVAGAESLGSNRSAPPRALQKRGFWAPNPNCFPNSESAKPQSDPRTPLGRGFAPGNDSAPATLLPDPGVHVCICPGATPATIEVEPPQNIYRPYLARIAALRDETPDVRTLRLEFVDPEVAGRFGFQVGQFGLYSALGEGESTFCIASSPTRKGYIECTFRQAGRVTQALRRLNVGDVMGFRGPYGNRFPVEQWKGKDLLFVAGGIALPPMRCVIQYCLDHRGDFGDVTIIYGARTSRDLVYKDELAEWEKRPDVSLWLGIDWKAGPQGLVEAEAEAGWRPLNLKDPAASQLDATHRRYTGFVPQLIDAVKPGPANRVAVVCGPPIMINFALQSLKKLGHAPANVYTTLENRMKCGLGKCGRCNVGPVYICKEGPVFTAAQVERMPAEM